MNKHFKWLLQFPQPFHAVCNFIVYAFIYVKRGKNQQEGKWKSLQRKKWKLCLRTFVLRTWGRRFERTVEKLMRTYSRLNNCVTQKDCFNKLWILIEELILIVIIQLFVAVKVF